VGVWVTSPFSAVQVSLPTFQCAAAALISTARAPAPALRSGIQNERIEFELPVTWMPNIGLP